MTQLAGSKLGPYEILDQIGAGGMGEVYRAKDPRLGRDVAIKVLPASFSQDADRLRRFEQEAKAAGLLNHPNITAVYDVGSTDGAPYVVQELLEGETLRSVIEYGELSLRKALDYAKQIAEGLAAAHDKSIVHRDLKPENLFVTRDERVKILDFGLAKLIHREAVGAASSLPTATPTTQSGLVMGTVGYMSPEQVRGKPADARSDIFSFGSILYEMLTGHRAFRGESSADAMSAILKEDPPDLAAVNPKVSPGLERIVRHCLEKNPERRFQSAHDLAFDLDALSVVSGGHPSEPSGSSRPIDAGRRPRVGIISIAAAALALAAAAGIFAGRRMAARGHPTFTALTYRRGSVQSARFAPDGQTVVYSAAWDGRAAQLFQKRPDSPDEVPISLPGANILSISKSGEMAIALDCHETHKGVCNGALARASITGGAARAVADNVQDADWAPDGERLAVARDAGGRGRIEFPIGKVLYETVGHTSFLRVSPKGDLIAFVDNPLKIDNRGSIAVVDLAGKKRNLTREWPAVEGLAWSPAGDEVWFTAAAAGLAYSPYAVTLGGRQRVLARFPVAARIHDVSRTGRLLMTSDVERVSMAGRPPGAARERELSWLDWSVVGDIARDGRSLLFSEESPGIGELYAVCLRGMDGSPVVRLGEGSALAISPDGKWVLAQLQSGSFPLVLLATGAGERRVLPSGGIHNEDAQWLDDRRIVMAGAAAGHALRLYVQDVGGGDPRPASPEGIEASIGARISPAPNGRAVAAIGPGRKCLLYPIDGGEPRSLAGVEEGEAPLGWSRDGHWLFVRGNPSADPPARIFRIEIETGRREAWRELMPADPAGFRSIGNVAVAADGEAYAYSYGTAFSQLMLVDGIQ